MKSHAIIVNPHLSEAIITMQDIDHGVITALFARKAFLMVLAGMGFTTAAFAQDTAIAKPRPPSISVITAKHGEIVETVDVTGTLMPRETISVGADVDGLRIDGLSADVGDTVAKGQVLARLETDMLDSNIRLNNAQVERAGAMIDQAGAQITDAQSAAKEAAASLERAGPLAKKGIIGQDILDQRIAASSSARAKVNGAQQGLAVAEADETAQIAQRDQWLLRKSKTEVKAPTAGLVLSRNARLGAIVSSGSGSLFEIARDGLIELEASVSEVALGQLSRGQKVEVYITGRQVPVEGKVRLISPRVDQTTRLGIVDIALPQKAEGLHVGSFGRGVVEIAASNGVQLPRTAVVFDGDETVVQVVKDGIVERRAVTLGLTTADIVEIRKGVLAGEDIVETAGAFVRDGDTVTPVTRAQRGAGQ